MCRAAASGVNRKGRSGARIGALLGLFALACAIWPGVVQAQARIKDIEDKLSRSEVIDPTKLSGNRVQFGATLSLFNIDTEEEVSYQIVGADQADIEKGLISVSAPLARALIGKEAGDEVTVKLPGGTRKYEISDVEYK